MGDDYPRLAWGYGTTVNIQLFRQGAADAALAFIDDSLEFNVRLSNGTLASARIIATAYFTSVKKLVNSVSEKTTLAHPFDNGVGQTSFYEGRAYMVRNGKGELHHIAVATRPLNHELALENLVLIEAVQPQLIEDGELRLLPPMRTHDWLNQLTVEVKHGSNLLQFGDVFLSSPFLPATKFISCKPFTHHHGFYNGRGLRVFDADVLPNGIKDLA